MKPTKKYRLIPCCFEFSISVNELIELRNDIVLLRTDIGEFGWYKTTNSYDGIFEYIEKSYEKAKAIKPNNLTLHLSSEELNLLYSISKSNDILFQSELTQRFNDFNDNFNFKGCYALTKRCLL